MDWILIKVKRASGRAGERASGKLHLRRIRTAHSKRNFVELLDLICASSESPGRETDSHKCELHDDII